MSDALPPAGFAEIGGSNYVMYHVDEAYRVRNEPGSWSKPGILKPVIGYYHLQEPGEIAGQLKTMYDNGQRKIAMMVWISQKGRGNRAAVDGTYGHCIIMDDAKLRPQHQQNGMG